MLSPIQELGPWGFHHISGLIRPENIVPEGHKLHKLSCKLICAMIVEDSTSRNCYNGDGYRGNRHHATNPTDSGWTLTCFDERIFTEFYQNSSGVKIEYYPTKGCVSSSTCTLQLRHIQHMPHLHRSNSDRGIHTLLEKRHTPSRLQHWVALVQNDEAHGCECRLASMCAL